MTGFTIGYDRDGLSGRDFRNHVAVLAEQMLPLPVLSQRSRFQEPCGGLKVAWPLPITRSLSGRDFRNHVAGKMTRKNDPVLSLSGRDFRNHVAEYRLDGSGHRPWRLSGRDFRNHVAAA